MLTDEGQGLRFISPVLFSFKGFGEEKEGNNSAVAIKGRKIISLSQGGCWEHNTWLACKDNNPSCTLTHCDTLPLSLSTAAVLLGAGRALRGGGARPQAAGAPRRGREEEPAAEGARPEGEALPEERPQGGAQGRAGGPGAAGEAEGRAAEGGAPHQRHNAGGASARALRERGAAPGSAALTDSRLPPTEAATHPGLNAGCGERERDCWAVSMSRTKQIANCHITSKHTFNAIICVVFL